MTAHRYSLFFKFLVSYTVLLFVPITAFVNVALNRNIVVLSRETENGFRISLRAAVDDLERRFEHIFRVGAQVAQDPKFSTARYSADTIERRELVRKLATYILTVPEVEELIVFFDDSAAVFSSSSTYSKATLFERIYRFKSWTPERARATLGPDRSIVFFPGEEIVINTGSVRRMIPVSMALPNQFESSMQLLFLLDEAEIIDIMSGVLDGRRGSAKLIDENGFTISAVAGKDSMSVPDTEGTDFLTASIDIPSFRLRYDARVDKRDIYAVAEEARAEALRAIALVLILGGFLIAYLMYANYRPLERFRKLSERIFQRDFNGRNLLSDVSARTESLESTLKENRPAIRDSLLRRLVEGAYPDKAAFNVEASSLDCFLEGDRYSVFLVSFSDNPNRIRKRTAIQAIESSASSGTLLAFESLELDAIGAVAARDDFTLEHIETLARGFCEALARYGIVIAIGCGATRGAFVDIPAAYAEARFALDSCYATEASMVIFRPESRTARTAVYPHEYLERIARALREADEGGIAASLEALMEAAKRGNIPAIMARAVAMEIEGYLLDLRRSIPSSTVADAPPSQRESSTFPAYLRAVSAYAAALCPRIKPVVGSERENRRSRFFEYMEAHFDDPNFTADAMAEEFGTTVSNLSHQFKAACGTTVADQLKTLRFEKAKRLLLQTQMSIREIVLDVGYYNESSFVRSFRVAFGCSPGEYRRRGGDSRQPAPKASR